MTDWDGHVRLAAALDAVAEAGYSATALAGVRPKVGPADDEADDEAVFFACPADQRDPIVAILVARGVDARPALWRQQPAVVVVFGRGGAGAD